MQKHSAQESISRSRRHHLHSPWRRGVYSFLLVASVMTIGTVGMHAIEGLSYMDAFYFMSMIVTAQGSAYTPSSVLGKLFASLIAFVSVGAVIASIGFFFGPFFGRLWHIGIVKIEEEIEDLQDKKEKKN